MFNRDKVNLSENRRERRERRDKIHKMAFPAPNETLISIGAKRVNNMSFGTTIQIFLPDGNPRSIRLAEITNRTIQAILIPRAKLSEAGHRDELQRCSVYFLIGASEEDSKPLIYVGEAEDALNRLKQHNKTEDFWATTIAIVSKTQHLTKTHIKYLEWPCYNEAKSTGRYVLENSNIPTKPYVYDI